MTFAVDWALKANCLSRFVSPVCVCVVCVCCVCVCCGCVCVVCVCVCVLCVCVLCVCVWRLAVETVSGGRGVLRVCDSASLQEQ